MIIKKHPVPSLVFHPARILALFFILHAMAGCTISPEPVETGKRLVSKEDPIFDKRFHDLSFHDIDLKNLWIEGKNPEEKDNIPIHNNTIAEVSEHVKNGVVNLYTRRLEQREARFGVSPNDLLPINIPLISNILNIIPFQVPIPFKAEGFSLGSGFIINKQGYVLTNAHVINNATNIRVVLFDGKKEFPATIIGADRLTDTALIKFEPDIPLTVLPLGNSNKLRTGEMVIAMGNPLGLRHSITSGIISAKERVHPFLNDKYLDFLQTDSAINPGSSGGPLLNLYGEVIGINTALAEQAQLIGFAIPINTVKEVMSMLVLGKTERGWFGIKAMPLRVEDTADLKYSDEGGILVLEVENDSPAEKAGVRPKDIIIQLNGQSLENFIIFRRKLLGLAPGHTIRLTIFRDGKIFETSSKLVKKNLKNQP